MSQAPWVLHDERVLPPEASMRPVAKEIYSQTRDLPLVSMHGHVDADLFARNERFGDPAELFVIPDHYLVRMLISQGFEPSDLGVPAADGTPSGTDHREIWRTVCANFHLFRGTPTRYWLEHELAEVFGVSAPPSAATADQLYDELSAKLAEPAYRPLALFESFGLEILATTDEAADPLEAHAALRAQGWGEKIVPTFRPDRLFKITSPSWSADIAELAKAAELDVTDHGSFLAALERRRAAFVAAGARASDHGHPTPDTTPLSDEAAQRVFAAALRGAASEADQAAFQGHMLFQMARMARDDGLVMQIHPGALRDYDGSVFRQYGSDKGFDIPTATEYTRSLRPMLEAFGRDRGFRVILFTLDETTYSRELAPIAGAYPSVRLGAPWWFLDSPGGMARFRASATETAGFYNTSGFVDDTRALASIPARHDLARRIDAGYLARLVAEHQLSLDEAIETAIDLAYNLPKLAYAKREER